MSFRFSDIIISDLSIANKDLPHRCFLWWTTCPNIFSIGLRSRTQTMFSVEDLALLKRQLQQTLAQIEAQEEAMIGQMRPQTLTEAQALEEKMIQALEELKLQRVVPRHLEPPDHRSAAIKRLHLRMMEAHRSDLLPREIHQAVGPHVDLVRRSECTAGYLIEVKSEPRQRYGHHEYKWN